MPDAPAPFRIAFDNARDPYTARNALGITGAGVVSVTPPLSLVGGVLTSTAAPQCGRLQVVSAAALSFTPFNGDLIKINGVLYTIPAAGIAGLGNAGVFVNGVGGQNLVANTFYYVYAFNNNGTITADFSPTTHAASATAGNVGTEIKSGDNSRTLIGAVRTANTTPGTFTDTAAYRGVISWFNRSNLTLAGASTAGASTTSASPIELTSAARAYFVTWGTEGVHAGMHGFMFLAAVNSVQASIVLDSVTSILSVQGHSSSANLQLPAGAMAGAGAAEGFHWFAPFGAVGSSTGTFYFTITGMIRG